MLKNRVMTVISRNIQTETAMFRTTVVREEHEEEEEEAAKASSRTRAALKDLLVPLQRAEASGGGRAAVVSHFKYGQYKPQCSSAKLMMLICLKLLS